MVWLERIYKILIVWAALATALFVFVKDWGVVAHAVLFVWVFGSLIYYFRIPIGNFLRKHGFQSILGFIFVVLAVTVIEEGSAYITGGPESVVHPNFLVNIFLVGLFWICWLVTWKLYIAKQYLFTEREALMTAGFSCLLYESKILYSSGTAFFLFLGIMILLYAALATIPMQLIDFTGKRTGRVKYLVAIVLPYVVTLPFALLAYVLLRTIGVDL